MRPEDWGIGRLFDQMRDAVIVAEASQERIVLWNRGAVELFGHAVEHALETPLYGIADTGCFSRKILMTLHAIS